MLKSAAVGNHGRRFHVRAMTCGLVLAFLFPAIAAAQPSDALLTDLVTKVVAVLPPGTPLILTIDRGDAAEDTAAIRARVTAQLAARGFRVVTDGTPVSVTIGCGRNLRELACVAEIRSEGRVQIATVTQPLAAGTRDPRPLQLALELRPLFSQQTQILDAAVVGDRLLVLDVAGATLFQQRDGRWQSLQMRPLAALRPWPRDPRGRIHVDGTRIELFVPHGVCSGRSDPFEFTCANRQRPWPIGIDNAGLETGRNYFKTPDGMPFYNGIPLNADAGARWLIASTDGALQLLNDGRRAIASVGDGDDLVSLRTDCGMGSYVASVTHTTGSAPVDSLRLSRVAEGRLLPVASPIVLPGVVTALWPAGDEISAVVITHDVNAGRYDAFQTVISCTR
jgi:hypothetical protein